MNFYIVSTAACFDAFPSSSGRLFLFAKVTKSVNRYIKMFKRGTADRYRHPEVMQMC